MPETSAPVECVVSYIGLSHCFTQKEWIRAQFKHYSTAN